MAIEHAKPTPPADDDAPHRLERPQLVRLRDGSYTSVRTATPADEPALRRMLGGMRPETRRLRFFTGAADVAGAAHLAIDGADGRFGLVAHDATGVLVGHALYAPLDATRAEVALEVADHLHGRGLGTLLIEQLAIVAERHGIRSFLAEVLPENHEMIGVFRHGFDARVRFRDGVDVVEFPTSAWRAARERFDA